MSDIDKLIQNLNKEQKDAVLSTEGQFNCCWGWIYKNEGINNKTNSHYQPKKAFQTKFCA